MASTIDSAPDLLRPAGQPLVFKFSTSLSPLPAGFRFAVRVYESTTTATGSVIGTFYLTPNADDEGYFDLSDIAECRVGAPNTAYDTGLTADVVVHTATGATNTSLENTILRYTIGVQDYTGSALGSDDDTATVYLLGGTQQISQGLHPSSHSGYLRHRR